MSHRYDNESNRMRGRERQRDDYGRFEPESERRGGRETRRYDTDDYSYREDRGQSSDYDSEEEGWRVAPRYELQGQDRFDRESNRGNSYGNNYDWDDRSSFGRQNRGITQMNRGQENYRGGYGSEFDRGQYGQQRYDRPQSSYSQRLGEGSYQGRSGSSMNYRQDYGSSQGSSYGGNMGQGSSNRDWEQSSSSSRGQFAGRGPKGYRRSDDRITEDVNEALAQHPEIDATDIEVKVNNSEVTLTGTVNERQFKRMAEDIVERCAGVSDVRNEIRVQRENGQSENQGQHQMKGKTATQSGSKQPESKTA